MPPLNDEPQFSSLGFMSSNTSHPTDLSFWYPAEASIKMKVFPSCEKFIDGVKLWAVSHVLVDIQDVGQNADGQKKKINK